MVALHTGILVGRRARDAAARGARSSPALAIPAVALVVLANALRFWVIATLGVHWNVRVVPSMPLGVVTGGPYRFVRHPNYVAVFVELAGAAAGARRLSDGRRRRAAARRRSCTAASAWRSRC